MANSHFWVQLDSYLTIWIYNSVGSIYLVTNYTVLFFRSLFSNSTVHTNTIKYCTLKSTRLLLSLSVFLPHSRWIPSIPVTTKQNITIIIRGTQRRFPLKCIENTFQAIQSTFSSLEMHSKRCYKICICSFVLGRLDSELQGPPYYFPENFRPNFKFYESKNFSDSSLHCTFRFENSRFPFTTKNGQTWVLKCEKLNFRKS